MAVIALFRRWFCLRVLGPAHDHLGGDIRFTNIIRCSALDAEEEGVKR